MGSSVSHGILSIIRNEFVTLKFIDDLFYAPLVEPKLVDPQEDINRIRDKISNKLNWEIKNVANKERKKTPDEVIKEIAD